MNVTELLTDLRSRNIDITAENGNVCVNAPMGTITETDLQALRAHKADVLAALSKTRLEERQNLPPPCRCHREQLWWRSIYGSHLICGICHPPVSDKVLTEWIRPPE